MTSSRTTVNGSKREIWGLAETTKLLSPALPPRGLGGHLALQQVDTQPKEDLSWIDSFAKQQAQLLLLPNVRERKQLWETRPLASVFDRRAKPPTLKAPFALTNIGLMDSMSASSSVAQAPLLPSSTSIFALQRIRQMILHKTDDDIRRKSLERITTMMLLDVNATKLGRSLLSFAGTLVTDAEIVNSATDVFGPKSSGTLLKGSNSMWRFSQWLHKLKLGSPFTQPEEVVYKCVQFLKESQAGATSASHSLEALGFFGSLLGFRVLNVHEVICVRVKGAAHIQYVGKRVRRPAEILTVDEVRSLEDLVLDSMDSKRVIIAGHLMFCLMAASRWWDAQHVVTAVASTYKGVWLVEAETSKHKTSMTL